MAHHLGVDVPARGHERADQFHAGRQLGPGPTWQIAIEPADTGWVRNDAVFPFHSVPGTPLAKPAHERVGDLAGQCLPGLGILAREDLVELRNAEVSEVDQAGRVVDDQADRHAIAWVDHRDAGRRSGRPSAGELGARLGLAQAQGRSTGEPKTDRRACACGSRIDGGSLALHVPPGGIGIQAPCPVGETPPSRSIENRTARGALASRDGL